MQNQQRNSNTSWFLSIYFNDGAQAFYINVIHKMIAVDLEIWKENREFKTDPKKSGYLPEVKEIKPKKSIA